MQFFHLRGTDLRLSRVVLGGHEYLPDGRSRGFNEDAAKAIQPGHLFPGFGGPERKAILAAAYDAGVNFFDVTLDSEKEALGRNLAEMPPPYDAYVQTRPEGMVYSYDPGNCRMLDYKILRAEVQRILRLLRRECIDVLNIGIMADAIAQKQEYLDVLAGNLAELKREGLIQAAAADTFSGEATYAAMVASGAFSTINVNFNGADDGPAANVFGQAKRQGMSVVVREAFIKGELFRIASSIGLDDMTLIASAAMKWVAGSPDVDAVIVGAATVDHFLANVGAVLGPGMGDAEHAALMAVFDSAQFAELRKRKQADFLSNASSQL